jgi:hypothetical protein
MDGWTSTTYGGSMEANLSKITEVAETMKESSFTWQYKPGGDGFGHVIYSSYACGRPAFVYRKHYNSCGANNLFEDEVTCIDTSIRSTADIQAALIKYSEPEEHLKMCEAAYQRFQQVVNYEEEFEKIKTFLENLQ